MLTSSTETERGSGHGGDDTDIDNQETDGAEGGVVVELANLEDTARDWMPRLFALYGIHRRSLLPDEDPPCFVGWGMEFPGMQKAVLWLSHGDTWRSSSATSLLEQMTRFADTRLLWLDSPDDHEPLAATS